MRNIDSSYALRQIPDDVGNLGSSYKVFWRSGCTVQLSAHGWDEFVASLIGFFKSDLEVRIGFGRSFHHQETVNEDILESDSVWLHHEAPLTHRSRASGGDRLVWRERSLWLF